MHIMLYINAFRGRNAHFHRHSPSSGVVETIFPGVSPNENRWEIFPASFFLGRTRGNFFPLRFPRGKVVGNISHLIFSRADTWKLFPTPFSAGKGRWKR